MTRSSTQPREAGAGRAPALELPPERLRRRLDPASLPFETTAEVEPLVGTVGQPRAMRALELAFEIETEGFNVFVAGQPGSGRLSTVLDSLALVAARRPAPDAWVYVHSFRDPDRPDAIRLPGGQGRALAGDMDEFVRAVRRELARVLESEEYGRRQRALAAEIGRRREALVQELAEVAERRGFALQVTPLGVISTPLVEGRPVTDEALDALTPAERRALEARGRELQDRVAWFARKSRSLDAEAAARGRELQREAGTVAVGPLLDELRARYARVEGVVSYLDDVQADLLGRLDEVLGEDEPQSPLAALGRAGRGPLARYRVNVLVDGGGDGGAPVVVERNPTYYNLLGRVEYRPTFGAMVTDFTEVKAGSLHRANGGFLVLEAPDVLRHPFAWDALKRALRSREIRIENLAEEFSAVPTASLRPDPVPLDVKVVLIGPPYLHALFHALDDEFRELFKVKADFAPEMEWTDDHVASYAAFVARRARDGGLRQFDRGAVARLVEHGARLRESQRKLSTRLLEVADVVAEASFWAGKADREVVTADDVARAVREREYRSNLLEERVREWIADGTIVIDTSGEGVGQVNGISVVELGDHRFGRPARVTARVAAGRGGIRSIEREIELSGPIHSKGVLTLAGYLVGQYAAESPLPLSATVTLEQSYDEVEGDSASSTELYALLSALSGLPLAQGIAVTGSVDQHGRVQAVGGVTRKVEGFFAVCREQGLTGAQGVVVPAANAADLMLAEEVVEAVREGRFHVWAVRTVDEGIEILTGVPAGRRGPDGAFPEGTVHARVVARLAELTERLRALGAAPEEPGEDGKAAAP